MQKIAFINNSDCNTISLEFNQMNENLIRYLKEKYVFFTYQSSINSLKRNPNSTNKKIIVPSIGRYLFAIIHALCYADVILIEGIRSAWFFPIIRLLSRKKVILHIHRADITPQVNNVFMKYHFLLKEYVAFHNCHCIITSHESVREYIASKYSLYPELIEQGADHVEKVEATFADHIRYPFLKYTYAFTFFDAGSENHTESVLDAFKQIKNKYLVIIGDWEKSEHSLYIKNKYAGYSNIFMLYPTHDKRHLDLIRSNAILFIHSSSSDVYSGLMFEAMCLRLPILAFGSVDNKYVTEGKASYFSSTADVSYYINNLSMEKMRKNAFFMSDISSRRHTWSFISKKYEIIIYDTLNENYNTTAKLQAIN